MGEEDILALYDRQMRADPPPDAGVSVERAGGVVRVVGRYNCILYSDLGGRDAAAAVAEQAAHFRKAEAEVEWKLHGHDRPADLPRLLEAAGFEPDEAETVMAFDLAAGGLAHPIPEGVEMRRVADAAGLAEFAAANRLAFGSGGSWSDTEEVLKAFGDRLVDPGIGLYVTYADGAPIAAARLEMAPGRAFAGLWAGGVAPLHRRRGVYRALVAVRAEEARRRGYRYLTADARETSRPILQRLGFRPLTTTRPWVLKA